MFTVIIVYIKKFLEFEWLRTMMFRVIKHSAKVRKHNARSKLNVSQRMEHFNWLVNNRDTDKNQSRVVIYYQIP